MKIVRLAVASMALTLALSFTASVSIWRQSESRPDAWWYDYGDGQHPSNTWVWLDGDKDGVAECYYFNEDGWLLTDTTTPDDYRVNVDGRWVTYGRIRHVYSTAATREAVRAANDRTYHPRETVRNHGKDGSFDEDTGKRVGGPESPFTQQTF